MKTKKRDTTKKRNSIIDAAIRAFRADGYESTSMDRIAEVAGASKRTVYNHFPSKEALFEAVITRFMDQASARKRIPYDPTRSLRDQLADFAAAKLDVLGDPTWMGILKVGLGSMFRDPELARRVMTNAATAEQHLTLWLRHAHADGRLHVPDPEVATRIYTGMIAGALFWPQAIEGRMDPDLASELQAELIETFLARYRAPAADQGLTHSPSPPETPES